MSSQDAQDRGKAHRGRRTPYELVFTEGEFESITFPRIAREAEENGVDPSEPERFEFLSVAADVVREVTPDEAPPEAIDQYRLLLFHAFNFWRAGRRLMVVETALARYLVESGTPIGGGELDLPSEALYLQLPANLFWSSISPDTPPEPIDGFFLCRSLRPDHRNELVSHLEVLVVLGIHRSRAGFSVIPLRTELDLAIADSLVGSERTGGDFSNVLPGGEISGLYSILTTGEVLKLIASVLTYARRHPRDLVEVATAEMAPDDQPPSTNLSHTRITLGTDLEEP